MKYTTDITSVLDIKRNPNYSITNKLWFKESELANQILAETTWVDKLNPEFNFNQRIILIRDNIIEFKKCKICNSEIKYKTRIDETSDCCSRSCSVKSTVDARVASRRENSKDKRCISKRLLKYPLVCYDYKLKNNKPYNDGMYSRLLANYLWFEYKNIDLVTKCLLKYSKQRIFNIIRSDLQFLIPEYETVFQLDFDSPDKHRILKFEKEPRICPECGNRVLTDNKFCSVKCSNNYKTTDENYLQNLSNGVSDWYKTAEKDELKERNDKIKNTLLEYNMDRDSIISKNQENWGYDYPQSHPDIIAKSKNTRLDLYGNENYVNIEQRVQTNIEKYGVENPMQNEEVKAKGQQTCLIRYGVTNIMQTGLYFNSGFKWKEYITPNSNILIVQGHEPKLLDEIFLEYHEDEILTSRKDMPEIWYLGLDGKQHRYFPDMFIPKTNTIYEVKSDYTLNVDLETNNLKFQAVKDAGFNFILKVY